MEPVIFLSSPPNLKELCAITIHVKQSSSYTSTQQHVMKCREFIFSESSVLASPSFDLDSCFNIIMEQSLFKSGRIQGRIQKLGLENSKPFQVHPSLYQACLRYTLSARLAPSWNKTGDWFLQGRDFIAHQGHTNAIKMNLCVNRDEIFASITGTVIHSSPIQIEDLNLSRQEMIDILKSTEGNGKQVELQDCWCHVLPSMKKGRIVSLSLLIPPESPFTCYTDLKRYWKNMYGYRLPPTDEDMFYCQVSFLPSGGKYFTYPDVCLRSGQIRTVNRVDPKPIMTSFLQDIHSKMGHVCGHPLRFRPKMHFATISLQDAAIEDPSHSNLTSKRKVIKTPLRSSQNIQQLNKKSSHNQLPPQMLLAKIDSTQNYLQNQMISSQMENNSIFSDNINMSQTKASQSSSGKVLDRKEQITQRSDVVGECDELDKNKTLPTTTKAISNKSDDRNDESSLHSKSSAEHISRSLDKTVHQSQASVTGISHQGVMKTDKVSALPLHNENKVNPEKDLIESTQKPPSKFMPIFRAKQKPARTNYVSETNPKVKTPASKLIPVFKPKVRSSNISRISTTSQLESQSPKPSFPKSVKIVASVKPVFKESPATGKKQPVTVTHKQVKSFTQELQPTFNVPANDKNTRVVSKHSNSNVNQSASIEISSPAPQIKPMFSVGGDNGFNFSLPQSPKAKSFPAFTSQAAKASNNSTTCQSVQPRWGLDSPSASLSSPRPAGSILPATSVPGTPTHGKRKKDLDGGSETPKKSRSKPQVQSLDIESLARACQLDKANTVTLLAWLKEKGVACKAKDKKGHLIEKIHAHLYLSLPEQ